MTDIHFLLYPLREIMDPTGHSRVLVSSLQLWHLNSLVDWLVRLGLVLFYFCLSKRSRLFGQWWPRRDSRPPWRSNFEALRFFSICILSLEYSVRCCFSHLSGSHCSGLVLFLFFGKWQKWMRLSSKRSFLEEKISAVTQLFDFAGLRSFCSFSSLRRIS